MSTAHQAMLKQKLLEDQQQGINQKFLEDQQQVMPTQMGFFNTFPPNLTFSPFPLGCQQSQKPFSNNSMPSSLASDAPSSNTYLSPHPTTTRSREYDLLPPPLDGPQLLSLQRSAANPWTGWGEVNECLLGSKIKSSGGGEEDHHLGVSAVKMMKKVKSRRKVREPRFCFKTMSDVDVLDDGYKWRKYGQKVVKNTQHPRSYYRCTQDNCHVKKRVERLAEDPRMVITTYEGRHVHSPSHDMEDSQASSHLNNFFW